MPKILATSQADLDQIKSLLAKSVPTYRQAYSDRTAWIMSCISELAYLRFNPLFSNSKQKDYFVKNIEELVGENKKLSLLKLIDIVGYDPVKEKAQLEKELQLLGMEIINTIDIDGTQAILLSFNDFIVIAFRGTEATSIKDIKSDAKAKSTQCGSGGKIHSGFNEAFSHVHIDIQTLINDDKFKNKPLFITGHSLGGALATVAAKKLSHNGGIAGCYTFGAPRVGDEEWIKDIKTPIYRVVNAADCVSMLPPGADTIMALGWISTIIPVYGKGIRRILLSNFGGYLHCGNMRYLTSCPKGKYNDVNLLYSVSIIQRIKGLIVKGLPWKHLLADHTMSTYRKKLAVIAQKRNKPKT